MPPDVKQFPSQRHRRVHVSLHHDLSGHLRMDRAVVGIRSRLGKRVGEFFIRIQHLGLEHAFRADRRMGNVIIVCPGDCGSDGYRERLRPKYEIVDFDHGRCCGSFVVITCHDVRRARAQEQYCDH